MEALGFLESRGRIGAIIATDAALKAANVRLISFKGVSGELVTVIIEGKIAAVKEAIESAKKQACVVSCDLLTSTIPRPSTETIEQIDKYSKLNPGLSNRSRI